MTGTFEVELVSVPDRGDLVAEVWFGTHQVAELRRQERTLLVQLYLAPTGTGWEFVYVDFVGALEEARSRLESR